MSLHPRTDAVCRVSTPKRRGFTLLELVVVIGIMVLATTIMFAIFRGYQRNVRLNVAAQQLENTLRRAQSDAMIVKNGTNWGVYFDTIKDQYVLFSGTEYSPSGVDNVVIEIENLVEIANVNLSDSAISVVFSKLSGTADHSGTITLRSLHDTNVTASVSITDEGKIQID